MTFRILSFDGGGIRGLLAARLFHRIGADIAKVDMIAGTSTGGLIALGLASGLKPSEVVDWYYQRGGTIFSMPHLGLLGAKYPQAFLRTELEKILPYSFRLEEVRPRVVIPAFKLDGERWAPNTFDSANLEDKSLPAVSAALATSAAPTYFPTAWFGYGFGPNGRFPMSHGWCDGGIYANDPAMEAVTIALRDGVKLEDIRVLSIGTGLMNRSLPEAGEHSLDWGKIEWIEHLVNLLMDGPQEAVAVQCQRLLGPNYCRVNPTMAEMPLDAADKASLDALLKIADGADSEVASGAQFVASHW